MLAAGGIGSGRQMAAALALGAQGVWTGSIWLTVAEADVEPARDARSSSRAGSRDTVRSRSLTGKPARLLRTAWTEAWERARLARARCRCRSSSWLTADAQRAHRPLGAPRAVARRELVGMPVGQVVGRMNDVQPGRDVIYELVEEYVETVERLDGMLDAAEREGERRTSPQGRRRGAGLLRMARRFSSRRRVMEARLRRFGEWRPLRPAALYFASAQPRRLPRDLGVR